MRFLIQARISTEAGNAALLDGTMAQKIQKYVSAVKPEAVYLAATKGQRTMFFVINMDTADKLPEIAEPLWLDWKAEVEIMPAMIPQDFEKAGPSLQKIAQARK